MGIIKSPVIYFEFKYIKCSELNSILYNRLIQKYRTRFFKSSECILNFEIRRVIRSLVLGHYNPSNSVIENAWKRI